MKKLCFIVTCLWSCQSTPSVDVKDIGQPENLVLRTTTQYPHRLFVKLNGYVNDTAMIGNVKIGKGKVNRVYYDGDYYDDTFNLSYLPYKADSGHLEIYYRFYTTH